MKVTTARRINVVKIIRGQQITNLRKRLLATQVILPKHLKHVILKEAKWHLPYPWQYILQSNTNIVEWFCSTEEAVNAVYRAPKK